MKLLNLDPEEENERLQLFTFNKADEQEAFIASAEQEGYALNYSLDKYPLVNSLCYGD